MSISETGNFVAKRAMLPPSAQPWVKEMERRLIELEKRTSEAVAGTVKMTGAMGAWTPVISQMGSLSADVGDAQAATEAALLSARDAITWSENRPVSPKDDGSVAGADVPVNPNATWMVYTMGPNGQRQLKETWRWKEPTGRDGDVAGEWVQEKFGPDTLGDNAVEVKHLNAALSNDITTSKNAVDALTERANQQDQKYTALKTDLEQKINDLSNIAGADGRVIVSPTEPQGADRKEGNLWVNTQYGAEPYSYSKATDTWVKVESASAKKAAADVVAAVASSEQALSQAQQAQDAATAASLAANKAQQSADGKNQVFYTPSKPTLSGRNNGDIWFDTSDNYQLYLYSATSKDFIRADLVAKMSEAEKKDLSDKIVERVDGVFRNIDAGRITTGVLDADRIAARSITTAKLAVGAITAESGIISSIDAGTIKSGEFDGTLIRAGSVKSGHLAADAIDGKVITGAVLRSAASGARTVVTSSGVEVFDTDGSVKVRLGFNIPTGIAVRNWYTGRVEEASGTMFGARSFPITGHASISTNNTWTRVASLGGVVSTKFDQILLLPLTLGASYTLASGQTDYLDCKVVLHTVATPSSPTDRAVHEAFGHTVFMSWGAFATTTNVIARIPKNTNAGLTLVVWGRYRATNANPKSAAVSTHTGYVIPA